MPDIRAIYLDDENKQVSATPEKKQVRFKYLDDMPEEKIGTSIVKAPFRMLEDALGAAMGAVKSVPGYYEKAQTEVPGLYNLIKENPQAAGKQFLAGLGEKGMSAFNLPHDLANYGTNRLNLLPENINKHIQMGRMPEDTQQMINQSFGEANAPGESLARGLGRNSDVVGGLAKGIANTPAVFRTKKHFSNELLKAHDALEKSAMEGFSAVSDEVGKRKLPHFNIDPHFIDDLREYFPKTRQYDKLIDEAKKGEYSALRKLQSDLYTSGKHNLNSAMEADRMRGAEMFEKRGDINSSISQNLKDMGQHDLSDLLDKSRNQWKKLQETYYNPNLSPTMRKMFDSDIRRIPKDVTALLSEDSKPINNLLAQHPSLKEKLKNYQLKNKAVKVIGAGAGLGSLGKLLYDKITPGSQ